MCILLSSISVVKVTFDKQVMTRSVSLSGDVFDPSGTLTGGIYMYVYTCVYDILYDIIKKICVV